jgi:hypothetical protein
LGFGTGPPIDDVLKLRETIAQRTGTGLQDQRRFYLVQVLALDSRDLRKTRPRRNTPRPEFLTAQRANDQIGLARNHFIESHHTVLSCASISSIGEDVDAACDLDELGDAPNLRPLTQISIHHPKHPHGLLFVLRSVIVVTHLEGASSWRGMASS